MASGDKTAVVTKSWPIMGGGWNNEAWIDRPSNKVIIRAPRSLEGLRVRVNGAGALWQLSEPAGLE
jgi:hypothetical protein